ncbi:hypothetical protein [Azospirillum agricola]|uniref:hypothetical protein n=1 Tax=Azospirillum agricola TaxID=1720247 RepID=UPI000A0F0CFB|nr:hypothetical protein [Azospirillum agricola]SMH57174.1 hypothetical protein SAMN02982994_4257 [Azospirillum lipoferum]
MTDQAVCADAYLGENENPADLLNNWGNSPYFVFPAMILVLIMPLAILFHPTWIVLPAVLGAFTMLGIIIHLTRG